MVVVDYSEIINRFAELGVYPFPKIEQVHEVAKCKVFTTLDL